METFLAINELQLGPEQMAVGVQSSTFVICFLYWVKGGRTEDVGDWGPLPLLPFPAGTLLSFLVPLVEATKLRFPGRKNRFAPGQAGPVTVACL